MNLQFQDAGVVDPGMPDPLPSVPDIHPPD
jgi:hypothetical protein